MKLASVEMDASIQCRASIDMALVNEYADRMDSGDKFPPVVLFGDSSKCWIGDGWHRILAAQQIGSTEFDADLKPGGRIDALKHALGANALHGNRRTNSDKRRCVEIALHEFPKLSSRAIAEMCGVSPGFVDNARPVQLPTVGSSKRTGRDGKQRRAKRKGKPKQKARAGPKRKIAPPCDGMQFARMAILDLEQVRPDDTERQQAFDHVKGWIAENENQTTMHE